RRGETHCREPGGLSGGRPARRSRRVAGDSESGRAGGVSREGEAPAEPARREPRPPESSACGSAGASPSRAICLRLGGSLALPGGGGRLAFSRFSTLSIMLVELGP